MKYQKPRARAVLFAAFAALVALATFTAIEVPTRVQANAAPQPGAGLGAPRSIPGGAILRLTVGGVAGVPTDASAAVLNVTVTNPAAAGFVTVWPCGQPQPNASNLNYVGGQTVPNLTIAKLGESGQVCFFSMVETDLIADVAGYFPAGSGYTPIVNPVRTLDTRTGIGSAVRALGDGEVRELQVGGAAGVPGNASAAVLNVTVTNPRAAGFVTVWPCGQPQPNASNLNYEAGQNVPNLAIAKLGDGGRVCFYSMVQTDLIADVAGYFPGGSGYTPIVNPVRTLDTRNGTGTAAQPLNDGEVRELQVGGAAGVPGSASAAVLNVTVTNPRAAGFVTVWPCGQPRPNASNLNYEAGQNVPNLVIAKLGDGNRVCFYSMVRTDLVADVAGFFPGGSGYVPIPNPVRILDTRDGTGGGGSANDCIFHTAAKPTFVAFCDKFDAPTTLARGRAGDLDPIIWGVSRTNTFVNEGQNQFNDWLPATLKGCGPDQAVLPPNDVRICNGVLYDAVSDGEGQPTLAMYPKQPFDFAGRTGTLAFDVSADSQGTHTAWPEFWITDQPVPAPHATLPAQAPHARNSFGLSIAHECGGGGIGVDMMAVTRNYIEEFIPFNQTGCVQKGSLSSLNHFEVRVSQQRIEVWASDPGSTAVRQIAVADNANLTFTKGLVWIEDVHYNACKSPGTQCDHTLAWDNLGWDGPAPYRDLSFDVLDANVPLAQGWSQLGYFIAGARTFAVNGVFWDQTPTGAIATFNWFPSFGNQVPTVRLNGGPPAGAPSPCPSPSIRCRPAPTPSSSVTAEPPW